MNPLILIFGFFAAGLVLLLVNHDSGQTFGMSNDAFFDVIYLLPIVTLIGASVLASRERLWQSLKYLAIWALIALALVTAYVYKDDGAQVFARLRAELLPGSIYTLTSDEGREEVVLRKQQNGHFMLDASLNNHDITMLVDTGASRIALTFEDAETIGLNPSTLPFTTRIKTANGVAMAANARIEQIVIGPIIRKNISASIAQKGQMDESLLGMNFLSTLSSIRMEDDEMRLVD